MQNYVNVEAGHARGAEGGKGRVGRMSSIETLVTGYGLVEAPRVDEAGGLYFCDAREGGVYRRAAGGEIETVVPRRRGVGGIVLHADGGVVVSGRDLSHVRSGESRTIYRAVDAPRWNDIFADAAGRIYAGTLRFAPFAKGDVQEPGALFRIDAEGEATLLYGDVALSNGIGFSPDQSRLYHSDSARAHVIVHDIAGDVVSNRRVFARLPKGAPDGLCVDQEGGVWVAAYGAARVLRFGPDGALEFEIELPEPRVTSVCFGGVDLRDLYVVTADDGCGQPPRGGIHRVRVDVAGLPAPLARI